ncbi:hypothetical protein BHM03_00038568 [Ensete ventricosum]|nr:hypothetical protein BHM03_00038568 [Ensete ventricosum]
MDHPLGLVRVVLVFWLSSYAGGGDEGGSEASGDADYGLGGGGTTIWTQEFAVLSVGRALGARSGAQRFDLFGRVWIMAALPRFADRLWGLATLF